MDGHRFVACGASIGGEACRCENPCSRRSDILVNDATDAITTMVKGA